MKVSSLPARSAVVGAICGIAICIGCSSTKPTADGEVRIAYTGILVPVPPAELSGISREDLWAELQTPGLTREAVALDGSVLVQTLTHDFLVLLEEVETSIDQRAAHNAARQVVIEAQKEAQAELERLRAGHE